VTLVTTVDPGSALPLAEVVRVETAGEMERAVLSRSGRADVVIMAAAVADFRPKLSAEKKLKKADGVPELLLEPTADILAGLARVRRPSQLLVGFAAETAHGSDLVAAAREKLRAKNLDLVVANDVSAASTGFEHDTNSVVIAGADGTVVDVPLSHKRGVARSVLDVIAARCLDRHQKEQS
jgi:phosphopantothenoylcysteine decarboxylase/phosphopantothenate--cysteine ligase